MPGRSRPKTGSEANREQSDSAWARPLIRVRSRLRPIVRVGGAERRAQYRDSRHVPTCDNGDCKTLGHEIDLGEFLYSYAPCNDHICYVNDRA